jgi:hypothetical protein
VHNANSITFDCGLLLKPLAVSNILRKTEILKKKAEIR